MDKTGYTLIVAEKPDAAQRIAEALSPNGDVERKTSGKLSYFRLVRGGEVLLVVPASGHLYTLAPAIKGRNFYPIFSMEWVPKHRVERGDVRSRGIIALFEKLSLGAEKFINATDYDVEGSLIGYTILKYACGGKEGLAKRMRFSTLTPQDLNRAYTHLLPRLDLELAEAGRTRHEVDWLYGVNLSRALTLSALRQSNRYKTLSIGRVQGPTLRLVVEREREIRSFVPTPYWEIDASTEMEGKEYRLEFEGGRIWVEREAREVASRCSGREGEISDVAEKETLRPPPEPFDLGSLQKEAYRFFGYTPRKALSIAERLYLDAVISYPRTSSQKLPPTIDYRGILKGLNRNPRYRAEAASLLTKRRLEPVEGKKEDPAHPAIYPTGKLPEGGMSREEARLYDLVVRRFLAAFAPPSLRRNTKAVITCEGYRFLLWGRRVLEEGWTSFYRPYAEVDQILLPSLEVGRKVPMIRVGVGGRFTEPPPRYNPASLLREMEEGNIGTKTTRAEIIETLYDRGYVKGERMTATEISFAIVETLTQHCPEILSDQMTRDLEAEMEKIERGEGKREEVLKGAVEALEKTLSHVKGSEGKIGAELRAAIEREEARGRTLGPCPTCKEGQLIILRSRRTGKRFVGCTGYFTGVCSKAYPLPQRAQVFPAERLCERCNLPLVTVKWPRRRSTPLCINPNCSSRPPPAGGWRGI